jgi:hypothetical protein
LHTRQYTRGSTFLLFAIALVAAWGAFTIQPRLLLLAFCGSFVPVGYYLLGTPGVFAYIGVAVLGYAVAGAIMLLHPRSRAARRAGRV